jgi:hypothetical protein
MSVGTVGTRHIIWHGGEHDFCIAASGTVLALEETCKAGIATIYSRLAHGQWWLNDVREPIRMGLIGGGLKPDEAMDKVKAHVDANPNGLGVSVPLAMAIIEAVLIGVPDDPVGKTPAPEAEKQAPVSSTTTAASDAQPSSELEPA